MAEASAFSRSRSQSQQINQNNIISQANSPFLEAIFQLYDQMLQNTKTPNFIDQIVWIYFVLQVLVSSLFYTSIYWTDYKADDNIYNKINTIFLFKPTNFSDLQIISICYAIIFVFLVVFLIFIRVYYQNYHHFQKWSLYVFRIIAEIFPKVLLFPVALYVGYSVHYLVNEKKSIVWLCFLLGILFYITLIVIQLGSYHLICSSCYLYKRLFTCSNPRPLNHLCLINSLGLLFAGIFEIFPDWTIIFLQLIYLLGTIYIFMNFFHLIFSARYATELFYGLVISICLDDLMMVVLYFLPADISRKCPSFVPFLLSLVFLITSFIVLFFINKRRIHTIIEQLNTQEPLSEDEYESYFSHLRLGSDVHKALFYLEVGFQHGCTLYVNNSYFHYLIHTYELPEVTCTILRAMSFIPGESRQLNMFFSLCSKYNSLTLSQKFLLFELRHIKILRSSSQSKEASERLVMLKNQTQAIEKMVSSFWKYSSVSNSFFEIIQKMIKQNKELWKNSIHDFPNSQKLSEDYARFLIDVETNFHQALIQKQRANLIETGVNFCDDIAFRNFVRSYPNYIKENIIDARGFYISKIRKGRRGSLSNSSNSRSKTANTIQHTTTIEIDVELENQLGKELLSNHRTRLALARAVESRKLPSLLMNFFSIIFVFLWGFAIFIAIYIYLHSTLQERSASVDLMGVASTIRLYYGAAITMIILDFAYSSGYVGDQAILAQCVENDKNRHDLDIFLSKEGYSTGNLVMYYQSESVKALNNFLSRVAIQASEGVDVFQYTDALLLNLFNITTCYKRGGSVATQDADFVYIEPNPSNLKNNLALGFLLEAQLAGSFDGSDHLMDKVDFCELYPNWVTMVDGCELLFADLIQFQLNLGSELEHQYVIVLAIVPAILCLLILIPIFLFMIKFSLEQSKLSKAMLSLTKSEKIECILPISKMGLMKENDVYQDS